MSKSRRSPYPLGSYFDFETLYPNSSVVTFEIWNLGSADLELYPPYAVISGIFAGDYTISSYPAPTVPQGGSTTMDIVFAPGAPGSAPRDHHDPVQRPGRADLYYQPERDSGHTAQDGSRRQRHHIGI